MPFSGYNKTIGRVILILGGVYEWGERLTVFA
ncbi:hypothetical protein LCGC14_2309790, partial [marine sediment metagenome]